MLQGLVKRVTASVIGCRLGHDMIWLGTLSTCLPILSDSRTCNTYIQPCQAHLERQTNRPLPKKAPIKGHKPTSQTPAQRLARSLALFTHVDIAGINICISSIVTDQISTGHRSSGVNIATSVPSCFSKSSTFTFSALPTQQFPGRVPAG